MNASLNSWLKIEIIRVEKMEEAFKAFDFGDTKVLNHTSDWLNKCGVPAYYRTVFIEKAGEKMVVDFVVKFAHEDSPDIVEVLMTNYEEYLEDSNLI